jgi:ubiquinone/menaquinone biosynthesis C-methylase UbiE
MAIVDLQIMALFNYLWFRIVAFGFHLLYHQLAPTYDLVSWLVSFGKWRQWQLAALPFIKGTDVLDLAHGPGHMLVALQEAGYQVTGIDLSPQMGKLAMGNVRAKNAWVSLIQAPAQKLPVASGSFDTVLATFPTEFISDVKSLEEIHRVLRQDGRLVIVPQAQLTGGSIPVRLLEMLYRITGQRNVPHDGSEQIHRSNPYQIMKQRFSEAGFDVRMKRVMQPGSEVIIVVATRNNA